MEIPPPPVTNISITAPKVITFSKTIASYKINNISVVLNTSASIDVWLYDSSNSFIGTTTFIMSGTDYTNWSSNDVPYVENWVVAQINLMTSL